MIVNARMYAVATPVVQAWRALFALAGTRAVVDWSWIDHAAPAPVNALWARPDCGCVFMCGLPFISSPVRKRLLAAPVPALPRYGDRPVYYPSSSCAPMRRSLLWSRASARASPACWKSQTRATTRRAITCCALRPQMRKRCTGGRLRQRPHRAR